MQRIGNARFLAIFEYLNLDDKPHTILKHETRTLSDGLKCSCFMFQYGMRFITEIKIFKNSPKTRVSYSLHIV